MSCMISQFRVKIFMSIHVSKQEKMFEKLTLDLSVVFVF